MKTPKFSHLTPHLKGKQHQLDPNLDLKQSIKHASIQYVDWDNDGDVDEYDKKPKLVPDENPQADFGTVSKKLISKQKGEIKHTKRGIAYEDLRNWFDKDHPEGNWKRFNTKGEAVGPCAREPGEPKPKCLSNEKAASMSKSQIAAAVKRKRGKDPVADRQGKGGKPIMSSNKIGENFENSLPDWEGHIYSGEKRYCPKCAKMEYQKECRYGPKYWALYSSPIGPSSEQGKADLANIAPTNEEKDHEFSMARSEISTIVNAARRLKKKMKGEGNIEAWVQSKITKAADYLDTAADYVESGEHKVDEACWKKYKQVGLKKKGNRMVPNCVPEETEYIEEKNQPTNPKLWSRAKALAKQKFDVYPSAYANGWASKWYKSKGGGWKSVSEQTIEDLNGNTFAEVIDIIKPEPIKGFKSQIEEMARVDSKNGNLMMVVAMWRGKTYALKIFFPQVKLPNRKEIEDQIQKIYPGAKLVYSKVSECEPGQSFLYAGGSAAKPGPSNKYIKPMGEEVELEEDWQKVNRQDKTDGLSPAAVKAYRRENPGSKLQTAVTEKKPKGKGAKRRANFCRRMKGMKSKLTSEKTARDPDSRINKALRRWRCR